MRSAFADFDQIGWGIARAIDGEPSTAWGIYPELACHYLDLFDWFAGEKPHRIQAAGASLTGEGVADHLWTTCHYSNGLLANLGICIFAPPNDEIPIDIIGPEGRITGEIMRGQVRLWRRGVKEPEDRSPKRPADYSFFGFPGSVESLREFVDAIEQGRAPLTDLVVGAAAVDVALAASNALATGRPATLLSTRAGELRPALGGR